MAVWDSDEPPRGQCFSHKHFYRFYQPQAAARAFLMAMAVQAVLATGLPTLASRRRPLVVRAKGGFAKIDTGTPLGPSGELNLKAGKDASGRPFKGKGVYQFVKKYGANVDGYSPIYSPNEWSPTGDVYTGGKTGLLLWAVTLAGVLAAGAFLVYSTSALSQ